MTSHTLYAYVDGSDLSDCVDSIESALDKFVNDNLWRSAQPTVVNQRHPRDETYQPDDLPDWDLGLNFGVPAAGTESQDWLEDFEAIVVYLGTLATQTKREFVVGVSDAESGITEDLFYIGGTDVDFEQLCTILGVPTNASWCT